MFSAKVRMAINNESTHKSLNRIENFLMDGTLGAGKLENK